MRKCRRVLSFLIACILCLSCFSACGTGNTNSTDVNPGISSSENTTAEPIGDPLELVKDGTSDYVIVRGENAVITEVTASTELQSYLKQISGVEIPIVTDSTAPVEKEIIVGKTNREADGEFDREELGDDGLVIKTKDQKLFLVGGEERGTLYAVYEFLESYLGCRFYTKDIEIVPEQSTITLSAIKEDKQIPVFEFRTTSSTNLREDVTFAKRKLNGRFKGAKEYGGDQMWMTGIHSYKTLIPEKEYYKDHPEYFSKKEGQPCLTNPAVLEIAIESTREYLEKNKDNPRYSIMPIAQNDNLDYCKCDNCMALYEAEESYGAANLQFINSIANALGDEYPNVTFLTLAYQYSRNLPKTIRPAENVAIILCTIEECFSHPLGTHDEAIRESVTYVDNSFEKDFADWAAVTDNLYVWDYTVNYNCVSSSHPNFNVLLENAKFFADHNIIGIYEENTTLEAFGFNELRSYIISKILWDPYMSEEEYQYYINDFLQNVYGGGWTYIREYFDLIHELGAENCFGTFSTVLKAYGFESVSELHKITEYPEDLTFEMVQNYEDVDWTEYWYYYADIIGENEWMFNDIRELIDKAYEAAETEEQKGAVERISLQAYVDESWYRSSKINHAKSTFDVMISTFFRKDSHGLSRQEISDLSKAVNACAKEQIFKEYLEVNKELFDLCVKYGFIEEYSEEDLYDFPMDIWD